MSTPAYKQGTAGSLVRKDVAGVMEDVIISGASSLGPSTVAAVHNAVLGSTSSRYRSVAGSLAALATDFTTNGLLGPNALYEFTAAGGATTLQLPNKTTLDAVLIAQGFDLSQPVCFDMLLTFLDIGKAVELVDGTNVLWDVKGPKWVHRHENWQLRITKGAGGWLSTGPWLVQAVRSSLLGGGIFWSTVRGYATPAAATSALAEPLEPNIIVGITSASGANWTMPTVAQWDAEYGDLYSNAAKSSGLTFVIHVRNEDAVNTLTIADSADITAGPTSANTIAPSTNASIYFKRDLVGITFEIV